jgi:GntR family transcriptional regulator/MocR family aminotransferase
MDLILDGDGALYGQLARALKEAMAFGRLRDGSRLPASRDLARDLCMSRTTVVRAYEQLQAEGFLAGKIGSGSYVTASRQAPRRPLVAVRRDAPPQSAFSRRARQLHDPHAITGSRPPHVRYAFQYALPMVDANITTRWSRELARALPYVKPNYPMPQGHPSLRESIWRHVSRSRGVACSPDDILVTAGTQQALSLIAKVLLDPGDEAVLEEPHYFGARKILQMHGASLVGVPVDDAGLRTSLLPARAPKLVYVTPSHQFPTGAVMSLERRKALLDYVREGGGWICEDDYDGEFRHARKPVEALQSLDRDGRVIYVGSFSKTIFPALRLGFLVMPPGLKNDFLAAKWADDFGCPPFEQVALAGLMRSGAYASHLRIATRRLDERRGALAEALARHCGNRIEILESHSGMHTMIRVRGMSHAGSEELVRHAREQRLGLYPADPCYLSPPDQAAFIMGFGAMTTREIREAAELFGHCLATCGAAAPRRGALVLAHSA